MVDRIWDFELMIYAIADLHLPSTRGKTMDRFGAQWVDHPEKLRKHWTQMVLPGDSVLVCGDTSWATRPEEAREDLEFLGSLPGTKYLIRGNHDYWWSRGATRQLQRTLPSSIVLLQGEGRVIEGIGVGGTRGWGLDTSAGAGSDAKIIQRELGFLRKALERLPAAPRVAMLHYPPYSAIPDTGELQWNEFGKLLVDAKADLVVYGHLHRGNPNVMEGSVHGIELQLVAADRVDFCPQPLNLTRKT